MIARDCRKKRDSLFFDLRGVIEQLKQCGDALLHQLVDPVLREALELNGVTEWYRRPA